MVTANLKNTKLFYENVKKNVTADKFGMELLINPSKDWNNTLATIYEYFDMEVNFNNGRMSSKVNGTIHPIGAEQKNVEIDKSRIRRAADDKKKDELPWMEGNAKGIDNLVKMHAFIVKDDDIPDCGNPVEKFT